MALTPERMAVIRAVWDEMLASEPEIRRIYGAPHSSAMVSFDLVKFLRGHPEPDLAAVVSAVMAVGLKSTVLSMTVGDDGKRLPEQEVVGRISSLIATISDQVMRMARLDPDLVGKEADRMLTEIQRSKEKWA